MMLLIESIKKNLNLAKIFFKIEGDIKMFLGKSWENLLLVGVY